MSIPSTIGPYRVSRILGEGHFGTVYLAYGPAPGPDGSPGADRYVAIKQLRVWSMGGFETLVREFELLAQVRHRSLCRVYEFLDREMAVVMEYVEGSTLRDVVDRMAERKELVWVDAALMVGIELADCLVQSWASPGPSGPLGLVHRDVKPENIMITPMGAVKLLDFGLAAVDEPMDPGVQGTPLYMSPEQARGEAVDHRSDLFALGLVLYELVMGAPSYPIPSEDRESRILVLLERVERAALVDELRALQQAHPRVGEVVGRCLARDPAERAQDGHELMLDLRRCLSATSGDPLSDFAAYYFSDVSPPPDAPAIDTAGAVDPGMMDIEAADVFETAAVPGGPQSTMANPPPRPGAAPPRPSSPRPGPAGARPRPSAPAARKPAMGGASWSPPSKVAKPIGAADTPAPAADQNLRMVPLSQENNDPEIGSGKPSSATEFFTIPKRQVEKDEIVDLRRSDPVAQAGRPVGQPPGMPAAGAMPHQSGMPPMGQGMPMAVPMGISGPVAHGALPPGYAPMGAALPPDPNQDLERAKSYRVFAVVGGLMMMVMSALVVSLLVLAYGFYLMENKQAAGNGPDVVQPFQPAPRGPAIDTAPEAPTPPPTPKPKSRPKNPNPRPKSNPQPAPAPAPVAMGTLTLKISPTSGVTRADIKCETNPERWRGSFQNGVAVIPNVPGPGADKCYALLKGMGAPMKVPVAGGNTYSCSVDGSVAICK